MALMPVDEALRNILSGVKSLAIEKIRLDEAAGRVLAKSIFAKRDQPPFAASAMDGYAVQASDIVNVPVKLKLVGTSAAGHAFKGTLRQGQAIRILTGAPLPKGADTVVIQENTNLSDSAIEVLSETLPGKNIRRAGLDFTRGDLLVAHGSKLSARDIGLLAAGNSPEVTTYRKPKVMLFTTGDELVLPGDRPRADQIISSNSHALEAMAKQLGAEVVNLGIVKDSLKATMSAVRKALGADVLLTTGGASVGDHDYVQAAFKACGVNIAFWKIALRPGKPFMYGRKGRTHVMGLPGNPVSALVTARIFLRPLMNVMQGLAPEETPTLARLAMALPVNDGRQDYMRATLQIAPDGTRHVCVQASQDSSMQRLLQSSHCLIVRPPHAPAAEIGALVPVILLDF